MTELAPPPPFRVNTLVKEVFVDQTYMQNLHYGAGIKMCWIDFGCPGHGKGPWDGLGAVLKQYVTRDITNGHILTNLMILLVAARSHRVELPTAGETKTQEFFQERLGELLTKNQDQDLERCESRI